MLHCIVKVLFEGNVSSRQMGRSKCLMDGQSKRMGGRGTIFCCLAVVRRFVKVLPVLLLLEGLPQRAAGRTSRPVHTQGCRVKMSVLGAHPVARAMHFGGVQLLHQCPSRRIAGRSDGTSASASSLSEYDRSGCPAGRKSNALR
jgi:hypothetical protein